MLPPPDRSAYRRSDRRKLRGAAIEILGRASCGVCDLPDDCRLGRAGRALLYSSA